MKAAVWADWETAESRGGVLAKLKARNIAPRNHAEIQGSGVLRA